MPLPAIWLIAGASPLLIALLLWERRVLRPLGLAAAPWAALPALVLGVWPLEPEVATVPWLLLGTRIGVDPLGRVFLFLTAFLWTIAGLYARAYIPERRQPRFFLFHLLTLAGNLGLVLAHDVASFYLFFALMTFSAYGLIVHDETDAAFRAGRIYIVMAVLGETMLLAGFLLAVGGTGTMDLAGLPAGVAEAPARHAIIALLLAGFGIKAGAVPLHMWLPLAHPVAPTPSSAVLSGCIIKAGLLGWLRFLPFGEGAFPGWGSLCIAAGLVAAFFGVAIGLVQRDPKTTLAYSSISQMGIINVGVGVGLAHPAAWPIVLAACGTYALHHGFAKGALFLSVGLAPARLHGAWASRLIRAGVLLPALSLAGAPLTSGAAAKLALKETAAVAPVFWPHWLEWLLPLTAVGTTLLMARFLTMLFDPSATHASPLRPGRSLPWTVLLVAVGVASWTIPPYFGLDVETHPLAPGNLWTATWPLIVGLVLFGAALRWGPRLGLPRLPDVGPGDILNPVERALRATLGRPPDTVPVPHIPAPTDPFASLASRWYGLFAESRERDRLGLAEIRLIRWGTAGLLFLTLVVALYALALLSL
jgi:formate hydrogenlyase subunit 3/multisubunit Na+/H+ antiporter MnhD subunit